MMRVTEGAPMGVKDVLPYTQTRNTSTTLVGTELQYA